MTDHIISESDPVLITGATGFVGKHLLEYLLDAGFKQIRCLVRPTSNTSALAQLASRFDTTLDLYRGDLMSMEDCSKAGRDCLVVYHLAVGSGGKSFPSSFMSTVIPTRNLLEATVAGGKLKRFVNVSSFALYSNIGKKTGSLLDESCPIEEHPEVRGDAYAFAKLKQDEIVVSYSEKYGFEYVLVRPGVVYGPGNDRIPGRVGIDTFGPFIHLGGSGKLPFTEVRNCAAAIALSGIVPGVNGEVFNVVDDDLPTSRQFLKLYKRNVRRFRSVYIPSPVSYLLCYLWERYCVWSDYQLPPVFSRREWHAYWKHTRYTNDKIKRVLGWRMLVSTDQGLKEFFDSCRKGTADA